MDEIVEITKIKTPPLGIYPKASGVCVCGRLALQASDEVLHFLWQHDPDGGRDGLVEVAGHGEETRDGDKADDGRDGGGDACADGAGVELEPEAGLFGFSEGGSEGLSSGLPGSSEGLSEGASAGSSGWPAESSAPRVKPTLTGSWSEARNGESS